MKTLAEAQSRLKLFPEFTTLKSACGHCGEFLPSDRTPSVGVCLFHAVRVLAQDKACSQYYQEEHQEENYDPVGGASIDDEF